MRLEKDIKYTLMAMLFFIFEAACGKYMAISGAVPMITLCFCVVASSTEREMSYSVTVSLILGILSDVTGGHGFGTYTVAFCFAAVVTYYFKDSIFSSKVLFLITDMLLLTLIIQIFYRITHISEIGAEHFWFNFKSVVLPMSVYNTVICVIYYPLHKKIFGNGGAFCK